MDFDRAQIVISDIQTQGYPITSYVQTQDVYRGSYQKYIPNVEIITKIKQWIHENNEFLQIRVFGATWCGDCKMHMGPMGKISEQFTSAEMDARAMGEIKVKPPYERVAGEPIWKSPPSPPETTDKRFAMSHIPAFFIFNKKGECLGKIDERPTHSQTIEGEIWYFISNGTN